MTEIALSIMVMILFMAACVLLWEFIGKVSDRSKEAEANRPFDYDAFNDEHFGI